MNTPFSSGPITVLRQTSRFILAVALLAVALTVGAFSFASTAQPTLLGNATSASPLANQNLGQSIANLPNAHAGTFNLPAASCASLRKAHPGANCQVVSYSVLTVRPIVLQQPSATAHPNTWYTWSYSKYECSIISCKVWGFHLQANGVTNHSQIWQYNVYCNSSGLGNCTWHGYSDNGTSNIEIGLDGNACASFCEAHGMRQWIHATLGTYYQW